jgi:GTP-binding protein
MPLFHHAKYVLTAANETQLPVGGQPEIAVAGRSNAGKSSAINALANHTRLAFVSKTPGRTQQINFFALRGGGLLADLPGYGYARVPIPVRQSWEGFLADYLSYRVPLVGLVLVMDVRHPLTDLDRQMLEWFAPTGRPVHVLLTKADKISRAAGLQTLRQVREQLADPALRGPAGATAQLFSALKKTGVEEVDAALAPWLQAEPQNKGP